MFAIFHQGEDVYKEIAATVRRGVKVRIIQTASGYFDDNETEALAAVGAEVRQLNMTRLLGGGVLHTKLWIVDGKHFFTGSANTDWRSLTQVGRRFLHLCYLASAADDAVLPFIGESSTSEMYILEGPCTCIFRPVK